MSKLTKRVISYLAILAMLVGMMPAGVIAKADDEVRTPGSASDKVILTFSEKYDKLNVPSEFRTGDLVLSVVDTNQNGKISVDANDCSFGTDDDSIQFKYRLKTGGKSDSKNNLTLTVPAKGTLYIAVRTSTNSDKTREMTLSQNGSTIYKGLVTEDDKVGSTYKYAVADVEAGAVEIGYTNGLNFYGFIFVPAAEGNTTPTTEPTTEPTQSLQQSQLQYLQ